MRLPCLVCFALMALVVLSAAPSAAGWRPVGSVEDLYRVDRLPRLREGVEHHMFSSYDRRGGNNDGFNGTYSRLRLENGDSVLAEMEGPGAIQRIWFTHSEGHAPGLLARRGEHIRVYLDGADEPAIDVPIEQFFSGNLAAFPAPLVGESQGGFYCYRPIPFRDGCKVVVDGDFVRFYQITYNRFPSDEGVESFSMAPSPAEQARLDHAVAAWSAAGDLTPLVESGVTLEEERIAFSTAGPSEVVYALPSGPRMIRAVTLEGDGDLAAAAATARIQFFWDGAEGPAVDLPLDFFFCQTFEPDPLPSLLVGATDQGWYNYMPMPYGESARLVIKTREPFRGVLRVQSAPLDGADWSAMAYCHGRYHEALPAQPDEYFPMLRREGTGHFAGFYLATEGPNERRLPLWLEGDERFIVDGELRVHGTGTEDYFNCGWYALDGRLNGPGAAPLHGFPIYRQGDTPRAAAYRWHLTDPAPYARSINAEIEHGEVNRTPANYRGATYFYDRSHTATAQAAFDREIDHYVPEDKGLNPEWVQSLTDRGERQWYRGADNLTIGMPIGGIAAGQLYLTADGTLAHWDISNEHIFTGYGLNNYQRGQVPGRPVAQGFALEVRRNGESEIRTLDKAGFPDVLFCGEYPMGFVRYHDPDFPVSAELTAFSPFIPLNEDDSALPATILQFALTNTTDEALEVTLAGWLQNAVCARSGDSLIGVRTSEIVRRGDRLAGLVLGAEPRTPPEPVADPVVFADFEGGTYGDWTVEGEAFGEAPATGTLTNQNAVSGFLGEGLVNTFFRGDDTRGRLTSPEFIIERPFIRFLIGGGNKPGRACINLVVDGKVVRTATGRDSEALAWRSWNVRDLAGQTARIVIVDDITGPWGHINIDHIEFADTVRALADGAFEDQPDYGSMGLSLLGDSEGLVAEADTALAAAHPGALASLSADPEAWQAEKDLDAILTGAIGRRLRIEAGQTETLTFVLTWNFPNRPDRGQRYAARFRDAQAVAAYVASHAERLIGQTRLWHETYYDATLPWWLLDRIGSTVSILATETCQWWRNGRFWAWEGVGCCHGTCTHVWNYEHAMARLFPRLQRSVREMQDLHPDEGLNVETGMVRFRGHGWNQWAADGQAGTVLKAYREHQMTGDDEFLMRNWGAIKKVMQFLIDRDREDDRRPPDFLLEQGFAEDDADGLIEGMQHNTYDIDFYGPNPMIGSLYIAALEAAAVMADQVGDPAFAERCRLLAESGRRLSVEMLFNGEYFVQIVDHEAHPQWQHGDGCLSDQLFGQSWARQLGLPGVYPRRNVRSALEAIWKYNWAPDVWPQNEHHPPERWYAEYGEAGLFICTWPLSPHLGSESVRYRDEVWTGIEYQVATSMAWEGMIDEALVICRAIHDRYDPAKRNPYNEVECGDHYSRAMASWGVLTGLSGFSSDGPAGTISFQPRFQPDDFRAPFTAAGAWGVVAQQRADGRQVNTLETRWGRLDLQRLDLAVPGAMGRGAGEATDRPVVTATRNGQPVEVQLIRRAGGRRGAGVQVCFPGGLTLQSGDRLEVEMVGSGSGS